MKYLYRKTFLQVFAIMIFLSLSCAEKTQEEIEDSIRISKSLGKPLASANKLCEDLPKPSDFKFVKKTLGGNSIVASIGFIYNRNSPTEKIINFYEKWSKDERWIFKTDTDSWVMTKGNQSITLYSNIAYNGNFKIICQEQRKTS